MRRISIIGLSLMMNPGLKKYSLDLNATGLSANWNRRRRARRWPVVPEHLAEVRARKLELIAKTEAAVKDRLTKEIIYWDHRAEDLKLQEQAGQPNARLNSGEARKRADALASAVREAHGRAEVGAADLRRCRRWYWAACSSCRWD